MKRAKAIAMLAWAFWSRQFRRLFRGRKDDGGLDRFLANYVPDGMPPLSLEQERAVLIHGNCIFCGLCEAVCPVPVDRWLVYSRALTLAAEATASMPDVCEVGCSRCADICPTGVNPIEVAEFVRSRAKVMP